MKRDKEKTLILGLGRSGCAVAELLLHQGEAVVLYDDQPSAYDQSRVVQLVERGAQVEQDATLLMDMVWRECVISPGISLKKGVACSLRAVGVPLISEVEVGWRQYRKKKKDGIVIAVTGSNGKSSVVKCLTEMMQLQGLTATACGNYGIPVCAVVQQDNVPDVLVVEVSSFQLESMHDFAPEAAILLNLLPNHLDRHGNMERYERTKLSMFFAMDASSPAIIPTAQFAALEKECAFRGRPVPNRITHGCHTDADWIYSSGQVRQRHGTVCVNMDSSYFDNAILGDAAAAMVALAHHMNVDVQQMEQAFRSFQPLPHRCETVGVWRNVLFVNDSKSTNLASLMGAVAMAERPVRLIAGGRAKEKDFSGAKDLLATRGKCVYLIGDHAQAMFDCWHTVVECRLCGTMDQALSQAWAASQSGDEILLSPGCTSYDQFNNFEERGEYFRNKVRLLTSGV